MVRWRHVNLSITGKEDAYLEGNLLVCMQGRLFGFYASRKLFMFCTLYQAGLIGSIWMSLQSCFASASVESPSHQSESMNNLLQCLSTKPCLFYVVFFLKKCANSFCLLFDTFYGFYSWYMTKPYKQRPQKKPFKICTVWQNNPSSILFC